MFEALSRGGVALLKREKASLVAATGLIFEHLKETSKDISLQDSLTSYKGGTWGNESVEGIGYPVLRSSNMRGKRVNVAEAAWCQIPDEQAKAFSLESGDILVTKSSGSFDLVGKAALFDDPNNGNIYLFSNFTMRLRPDRKKVIPEYLAWFLRSPQALSWRFENQQTTVGLRNLQTREYLSQVIPIPSLEIQKQIVNYLNSVETESEESTIMKLPEALEKQRHAVERVEALAARIAKAQSLRREASKEVDILLTRATTYALDEQDWEIQRLENVLRESPRNGFSPQSKVEGEGKRMLRINAVSSSPNRFVDLSAFNVVDVPEEKAAPFYMQNNEVFVVRYNGDINRVAKAAIYKAKDDEKIIFPDKLIRLRANEEIILPDYLVFALSSRKVRSQIEELGKTTAGNIGISGSNIKSFMIPVPPLDEQRRIVAYLDSVQARLASLRELQSQTGDELDALLPSVLDRAFKGEL